MNPYTYSGNAQQMMILYYVICIVLKVMGSYSDVVILRHPTPG